VTEPSARPDPASLVRCVDLARIYGSGERAVTAVRGVTCHLDPGMQVALTGPSGSGKSTLLHLLAGLDTPTSGAISWPGLGGSLGGRPGLAGLVFQGPSLLPPLDVAENVALPLLLAGCSEAEARERAGAALRDVQVADLATRLPEELSGGQSQRVAVARALAPGPRLILADEPTGQLDAAHASQIADLLTAAAARLGAGLVVATHDPSIAARLPCRWRMAGGQLVTIEDAEEMPC
jgi:putative ABC transport system ATP-binding protein